MFVATKKITQFTFAAELIRKRYCTLNYTLSPLTQTDAHTYISKREVRTPQVKCTGASR